MDTGISEVLALFEAKELNMKDAVAKAKASGHDIAQLVFKGGVFPDRASVDAWLKDGGYEDGYEVTEKKDGDVPVFEVASTVTKFKTGTIKKVKGQADGLSVFVGEVEGEIVAEKSAEEVAAEEAAAKASAITSAKGDDEADKTAAEKAAADEAAEAAKATEAAKSEEVADAVATVAKADAVVAELRAKSLYDVSELGSILYTLRWMVSDADYNDTPEEVVTKIKTAANTLLDVMVAYANDAVGKLAEVFKSDALKSAKEVSTEVTETATKSDETTTTEKAVVETPAATPASPVAALDPSIAAILEGLKGAVESLTSVVKTQSEELAEVKAKAAEAAEEASNKGQTRKGADVVQPAAKNEDAAEVKKKTEQDHATRRLRSAFGSYKGNGFDL
ncbi:hypothetical protein CC53_gp021 [Rhizobium phage vB_RleS_L338C]|uniref:hypothetical protein n=1 Tax=Rhizobium phage vB_RleS_L338C TaxID=1414737 RepID=UPI0003D82C91|nr:hypothetical protein CC53_gp021 [Rhizobium phage vB_RleS_L338C]AHC30438.1 hypothetical protein L338C_021 [Rhizobium phage vB_RleS_L338C]